MKPDNDREFIAMIARCQAEARESATFWMRAFDVATGFVFGLALYWMLTHPQ